MANWTYKCYSDRSQQTLWQRWYDENEDFQGSHDSIFEIIEQYESWGEPQVKLFDSRNRIFEIRLTGNIKHRILGFYSDVVRQQFVVLGICYHKQNVYTPRDIKNTVIKRKNEIEQDQRKAIHCARPK